MRKTGIYYQVTKFEDVGGTNLSYEPKFLPKKLYKPFKLEHFQWGGGEGGGGLQILDLSKV